jgi:hypothetical protein
MPPPRTRGFPRPHESCGYNCDRPRVLGPLHSPRWVERERANGRREDSSSPPEVARGVEWRGRCKAPRLRRLGELDWLNLSAAGDASIQTPRAAQFHHGFGCGSRDGGRHLSRMFDWHEDQQQVRPHLRPSGPTVESCSVLASRCWICSGSP